MLHNPAKSLGFAYSGLRVAWREELSFRIQLAIGAATVAAGWYVQLSNNEWATIVIVIGAVLAVEALNTSIEELCDMYSSNPDPHIAKIKDLAAAAALLIALAAIAVGIIVFYPHIVTLL